MNDTDLQPRPSPKIIPRSEHTVSRANVSSNALKVLYRLKNAGYAAFLVGGGVRDLLLDKHPKDFDIVTDAHPEEVKRLFRNSRLIGRRFRLAHVRFGRDIVEVATFRAAGAEDDDDERLQSENGRIIRDNVYGSVDEDIWRRDFTVNALYYNIADYTLLDYTCGLDDIRNRTLRLIGEPTTRYREDPVRMLRAIRFAAKLGFEIAPETGEPIKRLGGLMAEVPAARIYDELLKLFHGGRAVRSFELLLEYGLFGYLFPATDALLQGEEREAALQLINLGLADTDARVAADKPVSPMYLYAVLLWPAIKRQTRLLKEEGAREVEALAEASRGVVVEQQQKTAFPKRFSAPMREVIVMQRRFLSRGGIRGARLLQHKRFRAAYDFLVLRSRCGEVDKEVAEWWTQVQEYTPTEQRQAFGIKRQRAARRRRRPRREPEA